MEKITQEQKDTMDMITMIASNGNPGALTTLMELQQSEGFQNFMSITDVLSKWGVRDSRIWILYNDCCDRDIKLFADVVKKMPEEYVMDHIGRNNQGSAHGEPIDPDEVNSQTEEINMSPGTWGMGRVHGE